jgi:hypothetical protein
MNRRQVFGGVHLSHLSWWQSAIVVSIALSPHGTDRPLIVDWNAMLIRRISGKLVRPLTGGTRRSCSDCTLRVQALLSQP